MKKFCFSILFLVVLFNTSFSAPVIKSVSTGYWNTTSTWDLNRLPQAGDSIVISTGTTVTVNDDQYLNGASYLRIYGKLNFQNNNSTLNFGNNSFIWVFDGGQITGGGSASQKLKLNGTIIFQGNDAPINGPEMASVASNGFASFVSASSALPVKFVGFTVTHNNNDVLVQWSTSEEISADMYQVERSFDGTNWSTIAYVTAIGNSSATSNYSFTDKNISSNITYYRIKEVDIDGKFTFTSIQSIRANITSTASDIKVASIQDKILLQFPQQVKGSLVVRFVSLSGQIIDQQSINNPVGQVVLNSKLTGNYIISVSNGRDINTAKQVIL